MANPYLFVSALLLLAVPHLCSVLRFWASAPHALRCLYIAGPCTSVWNHGSNSRAALWADRSAMALGCLIDCRFILFVLPRCTADGVTISALLAAAVALYSLAKMLASDPLHVLSHACVSAAHFAMLAAWPHAAASGSSSTPPPFAACLEFCRAAAVFGGN